MASVTSRNHTGHLFWNNLTRWFFNFSSLLKFRLSSNSPLQIKKQKYTYSEDSFDPVTKNSYAIKSDRIGPDYLESFENPWKKAYLLCKRFHFSYWITQMGSKYNLAEHRVKLSWQQMWLRFRLNPVGGVIWFSSYSTDSFSSPTFRADTEFLFSQFHRATHNTTC